VGRLVRAGRPPKKEELVSSLTVGSHPVGDSIGKSDNEGMSFDNMPTGVAQSTAAVDGLLGQARWG
jgi:hypothetical protein